MPKCRLRRGNTGLWVGEIMENRTWWPVTTMCLTKLGAKIELKHYIQEEYGEEVMFSEV